MGELFVACLKISHQYLLIPKPTPRALQHVCQMHPRLICEPGIQARVPGGSLSLEFQTGLSGPCLHLLTLDEVAAFATPMSLVL